MRENTVPVTKMKAIAYKRGQNIRKKKTETSGVKHDKRNEAVHNIKKSSYFMMKPFVIFLHKSNTRVESNPC